MRKGLFTAAVDIVNGVWDVGNEVYRTVSDEISDAVDEEALRRTRHYFKGDFVDENSRAFRTRLQTEREAVAREYKSVAVKGGLLALGLGFFF